MAESVTLTEIAAGKLKTLLESDAQPGSGLRVRVVPGGCNGYSYDMVFDSPSEDDLVFESHGLKVLVDAKSIDLLKGSEIDFQESFGSSGFLIKNPNATGGCGCGKSFQA
jgi:iron-sulfur cluster assembly accessory protein